MHHGLVIKSTGKFYTVKHDVTLEEHTAVIRGKFKLQGFKLTNPVAVGDKVQFTLGDNGQAVIEEIDPRKNYVVRQSPRKKHFLHLLAANIDQAILIVTITEPNLKQGFIDRFLLMTEPYDIPVHVIFNKSDLYDPGHMNVYNYLKEIYEAIDYRVFLTSVNDDLGFEAIKEVIKDKVTLISGQSGVGKSSIINRLCNGANIKTKELSDYSGKGQHTTTFAEMYALEEGSIIDTPGIKTLSFNHLEIMDIAHNFREFFKKSSDCKFQNCTHRQEPHCAVKEAIETEEISELRYANYLKLIDEVENQNYWERIKDY